MTDYKQLCAELVEDLALWLEYDGPPSRLPETEDESYQLLQRARAALAEPKQEIYYEFSVLNDEYCTEAGGTAPTLQQAVDEGRRYFAEYSQDGNYTLEVRRVEVIPIDRARAALAEPASEGPTNEELWELYQGSGTFSPVEFARDVLARWGK